MPDTTIRTVLHGLRLGSVVGSDDLSARTGLAVEVVSATLERCGDRGWVRRTEGRLEGWSLTRTGRIEGERLVAVELDAAGARATVDAVYRSFLPLNRRVLQVCTDWQVVRRDGAEVPNDHTDAAHDLAVLDRLGEVHAAARPLLVRLSGSLDRFDPYERRLTTALRHTLAGRTEWFTRPTLDSYHSVWFELHEDLLATLGRRRTDEQDPTRPSAGGATPGTTDLLEEHR